MKYLSLENLKKHLNVDSEFTEDDAYITTLGDVAETMVEKEIDVALIELEDADGKLPSALIHAMYLIVGNYYMVRESNVFGSVNQIPHGVDHLLALYRNYLGANNTPTTNKIIDAILGESL